MEFSVAYSLMVKHPIGARVSSRRRDIGVSQQELANAVGMKQASIADIESGKVKRPGKVLELASALRTSQEWLIHGTGPQDMDSDDARPVSKETAALRPTSGIQEIDVRAGLGGGGSMDHQDVRHDGDYADPVKPESWKFPNAFMRQELRASESQVVILETDGDSMEPTIGSGERIIVHTGMRMPSPDGIFALRDTFGNIIAKRLQVLRKGDPPRVLVISDNKAHATEEVGLDEITIVGRVLWGLKRL